MTVKRRMGRPGTPSWHGLLDAAETILGDEGYAALSSRNVARVAGVNQQLVYYYFDSMDALIVAAFRRAADTEIEMLTAAKASKAPLHEIWNLRLHQNSRGIVYEFAALVNRNEALRSEVVKFLAKVREIQVEVLDLALRDKELPVLEVPAATMALLLDNAALSLARQTRLGVIDQGQDLLDLFHQLLNRLEPEGDPDA